MCVCLRIHIHIYILPFHVSFFVGLIFYMRNTHVHVFLWRRHGNTNSVFRHFYSVNDMNTYIAKVTGLTQ